MSRGNNTYWLIVDISNGEAITPPNDLRAAIRFTSPEAADKYMRKMPDFDPAFCIVVRVPA